MEATSRPEAQVGPVRSVTSRRFVSTSIEYIGFIDNFLDTTCLTAVYLHSSIVAGILRVVLLKNLDMNDPTCEFRAKIPRRVHPHPPPPHKKKKQKEKEKHQNAVAYLTNWPDSLGPIWLWASLEYVLYIICACLPVCYSLFRAKFRREPDGSSKRSMNGKGSHQIVTFGSGGKRFNKDAVQDDLTLTDGFDYHIICETGNAENSHGMRPLDPVRVRRDFEVTTG